MLNFTPVVSITGNQMKKMSSGPREETLMILRYFARVYEYEPDRKRKIRKEFVN